MPPTPRSRTRALAVLAGLALAGAAPLVAQSLDEARALHVAGRAREALAAYRQVAERLDATDPAAAAAARNNACVLLNGLGEHESARAECEAALALRRGLGDERGLGRTLNNLAISLQSLGDYDGAAAALGEALEINRRRDDAEAQVLNLSNLSALEILAGRYARALGHAERAARLAGRHLPEEWAQRQLDVAEVNRGVIFERLGAHREALELYLELAAQRADDPDPRRRAQLELNLGVVYRNLGDPVRAVRKFEEVAELYRRLDDPDGLSNALLNLALAYHLGLERPADAESAYREALGLARRHGNRPEEIQGLFYLGRFLLDRGRLDEAEETFRSCLEAAETSGSSEGVWSSRAGLGRIATARGEPERAAELFESAMGEIDEAGSALASGVLRGGFFGEWRPVYEAAIENLADLDRRRPGEGFAGTALEAVQRAKARELLDALGRGAWQARPMTAEELLRQAPEKPILEFFFAESELLRWTLGPSGLRLDRLGPAAEIGQAVRAAHRELARGRDLPEAALGALAGRLLGGLDGRLPGDGPLRVAPDGPLGLLPFELLPIPGAEGESVIDRWTVSYVPSASTSSWLRRRGSEVRDVALAWRGFGPPDLAALGADERSAAGFFVARYDLAPLAAAGRELEALADELPGEAEILTGAAATESALRRAAGRPVRVLHLATHAVLDDRAGGGALLLSADDEHDGLVEPREIAALSLDADLTVLAACRTALESTTGGALTTLSGAFLAAGSSAVVATLWDVGDEATAALMEQFYDLLARGEAPAEALRQAKQRLRSREGWGRPALWAGYVLVGEGGPVTARARSATPWLGAAALLGALALVVGWLARRRGPETGRAEAARPGPPG